jgi:hypothetical protein
MGLGYVRHSNALAFQQAAGIETGSYGSGSNSLRWDKITYTESMESYDPLLNINLPRLQFSYEFVGGVTVIVAGVQTIEISFLRNNFRL